VKGSVDRGWERGKKSSFDTMFLQALAMVVHYEYSGFMPYAKYTARLEWQWDGRGASRFGRGGNCQRRRFARLRQRIDNARVQQPARWPIQYTHTSPVEKRCTLQRVALVLVRHRLAYFRGRDQNSNLKHETRSDTHTSTATIGPASSPDINLATHNSLLLLSSPHFSLLIPLIDIPSLLITSSYSHRRVSPQ
jgi:hypothetical protein